MSQDNQRLGAAERFLESLVEGEPDMTLVTEDFEYEQHFGSTEGLYVGEEGLCRWIGTFYEIWDQASVRTTAFVKPPTGSPSLAGARCVAD